MPSSHPASEERFYSAAICRRGHVSSEMLERSGTDPKCVTCGADVLTACPACSKPIRGYEKGSMSAQEFKAPEFCTGCGAAFPWASRQAIVWHIENQLGDETGLGEGDRRVLIERLSELTKQPDSEAAERKQAEVLGYLREKAPKAYEAALPSILSIATSVIKVHLGLPPG